MAQTTPAPVYPESFYNIIHPTQPWVSVQFRTLVSSSSSSDITTDNIWQEVALNPNNFFESMELTDGGGAKQLTLVLYDQYFSFIENVVMQSIFVTRLSNSTIPSESETISNDKNLNIVVSNTSLINLRVRFGYADSNSGDNYFDQTGSAFADRINSDKPVIRSDWYYFMIRGIQNNFSDDGLHMTVSAISLATNILEKVKLVQRFARIVDTPKNIINNFAKILSKGIGNSKSSISIASFGANGSDEPLIITGQDPNIEILLGNDPQIAANGKTISSYKQLSDIFSEIVQKVPNKHIDKNGNIITAEENSDIDGEAQGGTKTVTYSYYIANQPNGTEQIIFCYPNPSNARKIQANQRVYYWREYGRTIVESLSITTNTDFAIMSEKIIVKKGNNNVLVDLVPLGKENSGNTTEILANLGVAQSVQRNDTNSNNIIDWSFVSDVVEVKKENSPITDTDNSVRDLQNMFTKNINRQVFRGTITFSGDPFYSFDKTMVPFQYIIKIIVFRPNQQGLPETSYISGDYAISNIKHSINNTGYKTTLDVMRWPDDVQDVQQVSTNTTMTTSSQFY